MPLTLLKHTSANSSKIQYVIQETNKTTDRRTKKQW